MNVSKIQHVIGKYKIFVHGINTWVEVSEDVYRAYYRPIWAMQKRAQKHNQCVCPKSRLWLCDADCTGCCFHKAGDMLSLDHEYEDGDGNHTSLSETLLALPSDGPDTCTLAEENTLHMALHHALESLSPENRRICELIMAGETERAIAADLGIPRTTYVYRRDKLLRLLHDQLEDFH